MPPIIPGLHHVTAICGPAQRNVDFFVGVMALRFVKRTVNFDDPGTYHLYYGNRAAEPGSIYTTFPWEHAAPGRIGPGATSEVVWTVPKGGADALRERADQAGVPRLEVQQRFGDTLLRLNDPDGTPLAVSEHDGGGGPGDASATAAARLHSVTLMSANPNATGKLLVDVLGLTPGPSEDGRARFVTGDPDVQQFIDVIEPRGSIARMGRGTVHHIALRTTSDADQLMWREILTEAGLHVTPVLDRKYFRSIYFREPGGVLFEIATDEPGFTVDEDLASLGSALQLPNELESRREDIEARLPALVTEGSSVRR